MTTIHIYDSLRFQIKRRAGMATPLAIQDSGLYPAIGNERLYQALFAATVRHIKFNRLHCSNPFNAAASVTRCSACFWNSPIASMSPTSLADQLATQ